MIYHLDVHIQLYIPETIWIGKKILKMQKIMLLNCCQLLFVCVSCKNGKIQKWSPLSLAISYLSASPNSPPTWAAAACSQTNISSLSLCTTAAASLTKPSGSKHPLDCYYRENQCLTLCFTCPKGHLGETHHLTAAIIRKLSEICLLSIYWSISFSVSNLSTMTWFLLRASITLMLVS